MSGTDHRLCACYAMSGTELPYGATAAPALGRAACATSRRFRAGTSLLGEIKAVSPRAGTDTANCL
eukprot:850958-Rhodomonas_salina.4